MKNFCKKTIALLIAVFCLLAMPLNINAQSEIKRVRVAFPFNTDSQITNRYRAISGYTLDYLRTLALYTGWQIEIVYPDEENPSENSLEDCINMLKDGRADFAWGMLAEDIKNTSGILAPNNSYAAVRTVLRALSGN